MKLSIIKLLFFALGAITAQERSISAGRKNRLFSAGKPKALAFNCPEEFGYYPHPDNCSQYYVCVFGGALKESCNAGLMYSNKLNTCDWPRNVVCNRGHGKSEGVSTVKVTDPRTSSVRNNPIFSVTESLTSSASLNRDLDNTIRNRDPLKTSGSSKSVFDDTSKPRHGRFVFDHIIPKQNTNAAFQGQETASRSFNIIASSPSSKVVFPPILPGFFTNNRFAPATTAAPKPTNQPFVKDLLNNNDTDYSDHYFYYDDILYDEYYDQLVPATTTRSPVRSSSRSKFNNPISINSVTPTTILNSPSTKRRGSGRSSLISSNSLISSPASSTTFSGSTSRGSSRNRGGFTAKDTTKTSSSRGSSRTSPAQTSGGSPQVVGRTPQRLIRPSKKPPPVSAKGLITDIWKYPPRRPHPVRPQPQVDVPAGKCDRNVCQIPDCSCGGVNVPGNIPAISVPQMVLLTFDDAVNELNEGLYKDLFEHGRLNPNGCPISATFYNSHEWTDYTQLQNLYADGHEIASHSVS